MAKAWIRARLREIGKTQNDLALALGVSPTAVSRMLRDRPIFDSELATLATVLEVDIPTLLDRIGITAPPIARPLAFAGFIDGAGTVLEAPPDPDFAARAARLHAPASLSDREAFLVVDNRELSPFEIGDILFCARPAAGAGPASFLNRECVVTLADRRRLFRRLLPGAGEPRDTFTLVSRRGEVMFNAAVTEALAVDFLRPAASLAGLAP